MQHHSTRAESPHADRRRRIDNLTTPEMCMTNASGNAFLENATISDGGWFSSCTCFFIQIWISYQARLVLNYLIVIPSGVLIPNYAVGSPLSARLLVHMKRNSICQLGDQPCGDMTWNNMMHDSWRRLRWLSSEICNSTLYQPACSVN